MNLLTYRFSLDLAKHGSQVVLAGLKTGDTNRAIDVSLSMNGMPYDLGAEHFAQIRIKIHTGEGIVSIHDPCEIRNNRVFYKINPDALVAPGETTADIEVGTAGAEIFSTARFVLFVTATEGDDSQIPENQYNSVITSLANSALALSKSISSAETSDGKLILFLADGTAIDAGKVAGEPAKYFLYDFNGDGVVDEADAENLLYAVNNPTDNVLPWWTDPDFNGDGVFGMDDVSDFVVAVRGGNAAVYTIVPKGDLVDSAFQAKSTKTLQNRTLCEGVANALRKKVSGKAIALKEISPIPHEICIKAVGDAKSLNQYGKNLFTCNDVIDSRYNTSYDKDTQILTINGAYGTCPLYTIPKPIPAGVKISVTAKVISGVLTNKADSFSIGGYHRGSKNSWQGRVPFPNGTEMDLSGQSFSASFITTDTVNEFLLYTPTSYCTVHQPIVMQVQYEIGEATEVEPYQKPVSVPVLADGTVRFIGCGESLTLIPEGEGASLLAEYNRDLAKVIEALEKALKGES